MVDCKCHPENQSRLLQIKVFLDKSRALEFSSELERLIEIAKKQNLCLLYGAKNLDINQSRSIASCTIKIDIDLI